MDLMLSKVGFVMHILAFLWLLCAIILILVILIQKGRGGGLSGAFGGGMAGGILGSKTGDFLTWVTVTLVGVFLLLSVTLAKFYRPAKASGPDLQAPVQAPVQTPVQPQGQVPEMPMETEAGTETSDTGLGE